MNKILSKGQLIVLGMMVLLIGLSMIIKSCTEDTSIRASVSPLNVELGNSIRFADSTLNASTVLWEFGDDKSSTEKIGFYKFEKIGEYKVRLKINNDKTQEFTVKVVPTRTGKDKNMIRIKAPSVVVQNNEVFFMALGDSDNWHWDFGDGEKSVSNERNPVHVYKQPGTYEVKLIAANMLYPAVHKINVATQFIALVDDDTKGNIDFAEKLQNIIDGKSFNTNYNYLLKKYLSGNSKVPVSINGVNENDFDSYCHGLKIIGKQQATVIMQVGLERPSKKGRVKRVVVIQSTNE